jgi:hypothetical protein
MEQSAFDADRFVHSFNMPTLFVRNLNRFLTLVNPIVGKSLQPIAPTHFFL